jgi:predicted dinucleotide-binding enzyme
MARRVGVLGSGIVGKTLSVGFLKHGYEVMLGTRDPSKGDVPAWVSDHPGVKSGTFRETAVFGEMLVLAVKGTVVEEVITLAGADHFADKVVIDTNNPLADAPPVDGVLQFTTGPNESLGEAVQAMLPTAHVVKAFNSVGAARMINPTYEQGPPTMFLCGNHENAKKQVAEIAAQFGWEPYDCGSMVSARAIEPLCMLWCIRGFRDNQWSHAFKLLTK